MLRFEAEFQSKKKTCLIVQSGKSRVNNMRCSLLLMLYFSCVVTMGFAQTVSSDTFPLPKSHVWEPKGVQTCSSLGQVDIRQAKNSADPSEYFLVEAGRGESRLEIKVSEREVLVSINGSKRESYKIVANTTGIL